MLSAIVQEHHVTEKKEEEPVALNAFELISMSAGLNLGNLFDAEQVLDLDVPDSAVVIENAVCGCLNHHDFSKDIASRLLTCISFLTASKGQINYTIIMHFTS
jgi:hypothetical protein